MTKPSREDVLKVAGEPVARFNWNHAKIEWLVPYRREFNMVPLYTEAQALAMYAAGEEAMRGAVRNAIRSIDDGEAPEYRACEEVISNLKTCALPITTNTEGEQ